MEILEFSFFLSFQKGLTMCRGVWGESDSFSCLLPLVENLLMNQLDGGSRVLGGIESRERITGGERERQRLKHFLMGSSQSLPVAWDATTQLSQSRKQHPGCIQRDQDQTHGVFSCKCHTSSLGCFCLFPAGFLFAAITLPGPDGDNWPLSILDVRLMA